MSSRRRLLELLVVLFVLGAGAVPVLLNFFLDGVTSW